MLTTKDLQQILHVDRSTIYRMAEAGQLPALKVGRQWRFPAERIDRWLEDRNTRPAGMTPKVEFDLNAKSLRTLLPPEYITSMGDLTATSQQLAQLAERLRASIARFSVLRREQDTREHPATRAAAD